MNRIRYGNILR